MIESARTYRFAVFGKAERLTPQGILTGCQRQS
jgi:hypothetical protein